jgi:hypothetical protein
MRERMFDQQFGLRPRDQHRRRHPERAAPELALAGQVFGGQGVAVGHDLGGRALGADFAYIGSAFIATEEARAVDAYKQAIVDGNSDDIVYSNLFTGVHGNYLAPSIRAAGLDPENLPQSDPSKMSFGSGIHQSHLGVHHLSLSICSFILRLGLEFHDFCVINALFFLERHDELLHLGLKGLVLLSETSLDLSLFNDQFGIFGRRLAGGALEHLRNVVNPKGFEVTSFDCIFVVPRGGSGGLL